MNFVYYLETRFQVSNRQFNHIGDHIKAAILNRKLWQKDVAEIIGVTKETICHWESGKTIEPKLQRWHNFNKFLYS